jgi:acyl-CoA synthetase (AMP-forming)/AMP-acid ligase II
VAVVGKPDEEAGELPLAFVVIKKDREVSAKGIFVFLFFSFFSFLFN